MAVAIIIIVAGLLLIAALCKVAGDCSREEEKEDGK